MNAACNTGSVVDWEHELLMTHYYGSVRVEVVMVLGSRDLRDIDVHTAVVAPIVRAGHKDKQGMARSNM